MATQENYRWYCWSVLTSRFVFVSGLFVISALLADAAAVSQVNQSTDTAKQLGPAEARERIEALRVEIAYHDELYFKKSAPVISDSAYDQLKRELVALEQEFAETRPENESTQTGVGDDRAGLFPTYRHRLPMLSLSKSYSETELRAFDARLKKQLGGQELDYVVEPKFDGLAISVTFEKGKIVRAVTRGDGVEGDDVTANLLTIRSLPRSFAPMTSGAATNIIPEVIELRGEVYLSFSEFDRINRERESAGEPIFATPRNLAAGTLKQSDPMEVSKRKLEVVFYGIGACEPTSVRPESQIELLRQLRAWGVPTIKTPRPVHGVEALWRAVQEIKRERPKLDFPIDGAVVKLNSVALQDRLGVTANSPLWATAYKFVPERAETQIKAITLQVGRTGVLTPVAELAPVKLGGSTIARASLFNRDEIARRDIRVGDFVQVEKAGEIIPSIVSVDRSKRTSEIQPYVFLSTCPACHALLEQTRIEAAVRCPNFNCAAQIKRRIEHFASKSCVNISGLGPATIDKLVDKGLVKNVADLYRLRREDLLLLDGKSEKSAARLLSAIEQSKRAELWRFINGLGIPQVGEVTARNLARHFSGFDKLAHARREDFLLDGKSLINGVSAPAANSILEYLSQTENRRILNDLKVWIVVR